MLYSFTAKLECLTDDELFSYKLFKHPDNVFEREHDNVEIISKFVEGSDQQYEILMINQVEDISQQHQFKISWNFPEFAALSLRELNIIFNIVLRSATHKHQEENVTYDKMVEPHLYNMQFTPVDALMPIEKMELFQDIAFKLGIAIAFNRDTFELNANAVRKMPLYEFLQKVYIITFSMLAKRSILSQVKEEKVEQLVRLTDEWIDQLSSDDQTFLVQKLLRHRIKMLKHFDDNSSVDLDCDDKSLHQTKHNQICQIISDNELFNNSIVDLGCSNGKFARSLLDNGLTDVKYFGLDSSEAAIYKAKRKLRKHKNLQFVQVDFLNELPNMNEIGEINVLTLIEVVEHLTEEQQTLLVNLIDNIYQPRHMFITTPNIDYNKHYGMEPGELRHKDHKVEFNREQMVEFLNKFNNYTFKFINVDGYDEEQPSFIVQLVKKNEVSIDEEFLALFNDRSKEYIAKKVESESPFLLPNFEYTVNSQEITAGYNSRLFQRGFGDNLFYLGPTMAPADIKQIVKSYGQFESIRSKLSDDIEFEHYRYAVDYYDSKGLDLEDIVVERKYMGSRAYILAFKDENIASLYNMPLITINSRGGFPFFYDKDKNYETEIYNVIKESYLNDETNLDFIVLDSEITPWTYKAKNLVFYDFELPIQLQLNGAASAIALNMINSDDYPEIVEVLTDCVSKCLKFLQVLNNFTQDTPVKVHVFDILAKGEFKRKRPNITYGRNMDRIDSNKWLNEHLIKNSIVEIAEQTTAYNLAEFWESLDDGDEGLVIKPRKHMYINGTDILPYMKCRRNSYLQLIYGPYWLDRDRLTNRIYWRRIPKKRRASMFQNELSHYILVAFLKGEEQLAKKYAAAFIGTNEGSFGGQDPTL